MRNNQPVTQVEHQLLDGAFIVSMTDLQGRITMVNDEFVRISGFTRDELLGQPHNLVRHPDMPPAAFADLWATVQKGKMWHGLVKNRCKNGDFYWVDANVTPVMEKGVISGYISIRSKPDRAQVAEADQIYARMRAGEKLDTLVHRPWVPFPGQPFAKRLRIAMGCMLVIILALATFGWTAFRQVSEVSRSLKNEYVPTALLADELAVQTLQVQQLLTDASATRNRDAIKEADAAAEAFRRATAELQRSTRKDSPNLALLEPVTRDFEAFLGTGKRMVEAYLGEGQVAGNALMADFDKGSEKLTTQVKRLQQSEISDAKNHLARMTTLAETRGAVLAILGALGLGLAFVLSWLLTRILNAQLGGDPTAAISTARAIARGDLQASVHTQFGDNSSLMGSVKEMQHWLKGMINRIRFEAERVHHGSQRFTEATKEIESTGHELARTADEQRIFIERISSAITELSASIGEVANNVREAQAHAHQVQGSIQVGDAAGTRALAAMERVEEATSQIVGAIRLIQDIARQTNLLSLNAAIEAAKAGQHGKGFAVVAEEVRKLAERSAASAREIQGLIERTNTAVTEGRETVRQAVEALADIRDHIQEVAHTTDAITLATTEQAKASEEVAEQTERGAVQAINNAEASRRLIETVETTASTAAQDLALVAEGLGSLVAQFKV